MAETVNLGASPNRTQVSLGTLLQARSATRAVRYGMSERIDVDVICPNGHNVGVDFTQEEFEEKLKSGALEFHCNTCDSNWTPTQAEIEGIRRGFAKT